MTDTPERLVAEMSEYEEHPPTNADADPDLERQFGERVRALDQEALFAYLFHTQADSSLSGWLRALGFAWKDVPFATWLAILRDVADDRPAVYQFLWFASESLGLDVHRLGVAHPNVSLELQGETFGDGGPHPLSPVLRARLGDRLDYESVWRRLAAEGAPMRGIPPDSSVRHVMPT